MTKNRKIALRAKNIYGIDLGSSYIKLYDSEEDEVESIKNAIAIRNRTEVLVSGDEAYEMYEKTPPNIRIAFPMASGVISDFNAVRYLLADLMQNKRTGLLRGFRYLLAAPTDVTEVERHAFYNLFTNSDARARDVQVVDRSVADAIGTGLDVFSEKGHYLINIGGATTEYAILASGGIVIDRMDRTGGTNLDQLIASYVRREYNFKIGVFASEDLKNQLGSAYGTEEGSLTVPGRSLVTGLPGEIEIDSHEVYTAIKPAISHIVENSISMMERIPPEMASSIRSDGLYLTGGVASLRNLDRLLERELNIPVHTVTEPGLTVIRGLKTILTDSRYESISYSMLDEKHRWIE